MCVHVILCECACVGVCAFVVVVVCICDTDFFFEQMCVTMGVCIIVCICVLWVCKFLCVSPCDCVYLCTSLWICSFCACVCTVCVCMCCRALRTWQRVSSVLQQWGGAAVFLCPVLDPLSAWHNPTIPQLWALSCSLHSTSANPQSSHTHPDHCFSTPGTGHCQHLQRCSPADYTVLYFSGEETVYCALFYIYIYIYIPLGVVLVVWFDVQYQHFF